MHLVSPTDEAANILFAGNPFRMAVAKNDVTTEGSVIIAVIRKVLVAAIRTTHIIGIVDDPDDRRIHFFSDEIVFCPGLNTAIGMTQHCTLRFANVYRWINDAAVLAGEVARDFVTVSPIRIRHTAGSISSRSVVTEAFDIPRLAMQPIGIKRDA